MSRVLVGVFDNLADARGLYEELVKTQGIHPREIRVTAASPAAAGIAGREHAPSVQDAVDRSNSVQGSVGDLFRSLFIEMGGKSDDERLYDEAVRRGATVVMVPADNDASVRAVMEAMRRHRVVDVEARGEPTPPRRRISERADRSAQEEEGIEDADDPHSLARFMSGDTAVESFGGVRVYRRSVPSSPSTPGAGNKPPG